MVRNETPNEDLSQGAVFPFPDYEALYEEVIDASLTAMGRTVTFHLQPILSKPSGTTPSHPAFEYNPFTKQAMRPAKVERAPGIHQEQRIVQYTAHVRHGPADIDHGTPLGRLAENEVQLTTVAGSETHLRNAIAMTIDGRRFTLRAGPRPIGLGSVKYLISIWQEDPSIEDGAK